jgi:hypothetical protein
MMIHPRTFKVGFTENKYADTFYSWLNEHSYLINIGYTNITRSESYITFDCTPNGFAFTQSYLFSMGYQQYITSIQYQDKK